MNEDREVSNAVVSKEMWERAKFCPPHTLACIHPQSQDYRQETVVSTHTVMSRAGNPLGDAVSPVCAACTKICIAGR
jgi:hypothetical protein